MRQLAIFGATGTIGDNALKLVDLHPDKFRVSVLTAQKNITKLARLAEKYRPDCLVVGEEASRGDLRAALSNLAGSGFNGDILSGKDGLVEAAIRPCDVTLMAIVGFAGLAPSLAAARGGHMLALANKEALVAAGDLLMRTSEAHNTQVLPVDSEHNAIFQLLDGRSHQGLEKIILTASGGPFLGFDKAALVEVTPEMAVAHPNWQMGAKISVDSASLMNKGLELIEAHHLFALAPNQLDVLVHPQSVVHGLAYFTDGSVLAQNGNPDMRTPLAYCLAYPERIATGVAPLDLAVIGRLDFAVADRGLFPCLGLAETAMQVGGLMPAVLNGANEVAVAAFLEQRIGFPAIPRIVADVMATLADQSELSEISLAAIYAADQQARWQATEQVLKRAA